MEQTDLIVKSHALLLPAPQTNLGDGGELQMELNIAIAAVHRASFMSRLITAIVLLYLTTASPSFFSEKSRVKTISLLNRSLEDYINTSNRFL